MKKIKGGIESIVAVVIFVGLIIALIIAVIIPMATETKNIGQSGKDNLGSLQGAFGNTNP